MENNIGTLITSIIKPFSESDTFPVADSNDLLGGFKIVINITDRDNIPLERRIEGSFCYVISEEKLYRLKNGIENSNWFLFDSNGTSNQLKLGNGNLIGIGDNNGIASLDSNGKVPISQLPNSIMEYKGNYDALNNIPQLIDGTGNPGDTYRVNTAGPGVNLLDYVIGDYVVYNGLTWEKSHSGYDNVLSVNGKVGIVVLNKVDIGLSNVPNIDYEYKFNTPSGNSNQYIAGDGSIKDFNFNDFKNIGILNATTGVAFIENGTVTLTATPPTTWISGQSVTVQTEGNISFGGVNFTSGTTLNLGDELRKRDTQWELLKFAIGDNTITNQKLTNNSVDESKTNFLNKGKNLFNQDDIILGEYIQGIISGIILTASTSPAAPAGSKRSNRIIVSESTEYTLSGLTWSSIAPWIRFENANQFLIGQAEITAGSYTFTTPANCKYVTFSVDRTSNGMTYNLCQLELGATATNFEGFAITLDSAIEVQSYKDLSIENSAIADNAISTQKILNDSVTVEKTSFIQRLKNLFDKDAVVLGEYVQGTSTGIILTSSTSPAAPVGSVRSNRISALGNTQYTLSGLVLGSILPWIRYEKSDNTLISQEQISYTSSIFTFTTPADCASFTFSVARNGTGMNYDVCQVEVGAVATSFEKFKFRINKFESDYVSENAVNATAIQKNAVDTSKANFIDSSVNLFNINKVVAGEYIQGTTNGIILTATTSPAAPSGSKRSDRIAVTENTTYTLSGLVLGTIAPWIRFEDENKTLITQVVIIYTSSKFIFTTPENCKYITFSVDRSGTYMSFTNTQFELGSVATSLVSYKQEIPEVSVINIKTGYLTHEIEDDTTVSSKGWVKGKGYATVSYKESLQLQIKSNTILDFWINYTNGSLVSLMDAIMYFVDVTQNTTYTLSGYKHPNYASNQPISILCEDVSGNLLLFFVPPADESPYTFTTPTNCVKVKYGVYRTSYPKDYSKIMFQLGSTATAYEEYSTDKFVDKVNGFSVLRDTEETLTILESDKIAVAGCSYVEGAGVAVKNKALVSRISQLSNYQFQNWGVGGDRFVDITDRFRKDTASPYTSRGYGIADMKPKYITVNNIGNETLNKSGIDSQLYLEELKEIVKVIENLGAKPIFATDWFTGNPLLTSVIADFAKKQKSVFHDIGSLGEKILTQGSPSVRWWGTHPDTRSNSHNVSEWIYLINSLPKPEKSIKVFRKRSELTTDSINSLNYDNLMQRYQKFAEIQIGHKGLNDTTGATYTDRTQSASSYSKSTTYTDEYMELMAKQPISFEDYALFDITLPKIRNKSVKVYIKTAQNTGIAFYAKDYSNSADWASNSKTNESIICIVSKSTYDSLTLNTGDIYTSPQVLNGSSASINLVMKSKFYHPSLGYIVGLETQGKVSPTTKTLDSASTLTRTTGTGTSSISYTKIDSTLTRHSFEFIKGLNKPEGSYANISIFADYDTVLGYYVITLSETEIKKYFSYDNLKLIANLTGSFTLSDIYIKYDGGEKKEVQTLDYQSKKSYTDLISDKTFDSSWTTARWTNNGCTLGQISTMHRDYPNLISPANQHVALTLGTDNAPNSINRMLNFTAKGSTRKAVIRTISRVFPKLFREDLGTNDTETTTTRQITSDSFDEGTICVGLKGNNIVNLLKHRVDIGWHEQYFEIDIPAFCSTLELSIFRDFDDIISSSYRNHLYEMQLCFVSFEIE